MRRSFSTQEESILSRITYLIGGWEHIEQIVNVPVKVPFDEGIIDFLSALSKVLMQSREAKVYPEVVTLGFWLRKASINQMKKQHFYQIEGTMSLGRGVVFHLTPSNVPVNFAYSLFSSLLMGNANIVRVPSKDFEQVRIITDAINKLLAKYEDIRPYITLVRYKRDREINNLLSSLADVRIVWGGDTTIAELRKSPLPPRSTEVTFADRFSLSIIDSDSYVNSEEKGRIASDFYNDTYLSDQNACSSPRLVVWLGNCKDKAKKEFWSRLHAIVKEKYEFHSIMAVNKLTSACLLAVHESNIQVLKGEDNLIVRAHLDHVDADIIDYRDNSGYFMEYDCDDVMELYDLCADKRIQTIGLLGDVKSLKPLLLSGISGIDRITPIGHTMDFNLVWDGYDLTSALTRKIHIGN